MIFLVGMNPGGFPIRSSLWGCDITNFPHGRELHTICPMLGFSTFHVVGNANINMPGGQVTDISIN